jgi:Fungal specific transcription factor domain
MQLVNLAEENEKVLSMRWTKFDLTLVDEIQNSIINWKNSNLDLDDDLPEEAIQQQRDRLHCTEAWRYGLLIYITRVFRWNRKTSVPKRLTTYARFVFEHVQCCRRTSIVQKQAFLPLFFAGCETKDLFSRQIIRDYCQYWDAASGYNLFSSAASLLEEMWMEQDGLHGEIVWWGSVIDKKQGKTLSEEVPMQFCFG